MEGKFRYGIWKGPEWNGRFQEWNGRLSFILPYQFYARFLLMAFTDKYIRVVITKNMRKHLASNHLGQINRVIRS